MSSLSNRRLTWCSVFARVILVSAFVLFPSDWARGAETKSAAAAPFGLASVHVDHNATDGDFEVVFEVKGGQDGLAELAVVAPDGRTVVAFKAPTASTLGMRQFRFESPEPSDVKAIQAAYPQGVYRFSGKTFAGAKLAGTATLSHRLPKTTTFVKPAAAAEHVSVNGLKISWSAVEGVASYVVSITQDELNTNVTARLPSSATSFAVPDGFLLPGKKYTMSIGTVTPEGNASFVETTFTTEK